MWVGLGALSTDDRLALAVGTGEPKPLASEAK